MLDRQRLIRSLHKQMARGMTHLAGPPYPFSLPHQRYDPFFIIGSGRCGTTLLRRMLQVNPEIHIPPETYMIGESARLFREFGAIGWGHLVRLTLSCFEYHEEFDGWEVGLRPLALELIHAPRKERSLAHVLDRLFRYHGEAKGKALRRWGDKTPMNYLVAEDILRIFPDARFVHLVRDGVDVVQSILKAKLSPDLPSAAERWIEGTTMSHDFARRYPKISLEVRYEDLVREPAVHAKKVCEFLGIEFLPRMVETSDQAEQVKDVLGMAHHENVLKPISTASIGKGRKTMAEEDRRKLQELIGEELERFGYEPAV